MSNTTSTSGGISQYRIQNNNSNINTLTAAQIEFISEDEIVTVVPRFKMETLKLIRGEFGPFHAGFPVQVPLWLAINLKKKQMCKIQQPLWMEADYLANILEKEKRESQFFEILPPHYIEIALQLLAIAGDDFRDVARVRSLIEDIENVRYNKISEGIKVISGPIPGLQVNNLSVMEINRMRPFVSLSLHKMQKQFGEKPEEEQEQEKQEQEQQQQQEDNDNEQESRRTTTTTTTSTTSTTTTTTTTTHQPRRVLRRRNNPSGDVDDDENQ